MIARIFIVLSLLLSPSQLLSPTDGRLAAESTGEAAQDPVVEPADAAAKEAANQDAGSVEETKGAADESGTATADDPTDSTEGPDTKTADGKGITTPDSTGPPAAPLLARTQHWRVGVVVNATGGACKNIMATIPVPSDWPEQVVEIAKEDFSREVSRVSYRTLNGGVKQMIVEIPSLGNGGKATALVTFTIRREPIASPADPSALRIPERQAAREVKRYLSPSPYIESRHPKIRQALKEAVADKTGAWEQVEAIYDYVRKRVTYKEGDLKGAVDALKDGTGDCEELTSLFIAMCRAHRVPARMVWVPDHCYPEFYLVDEKGDGVWIPCQAAGTRAFGSMPDLRPILQKGDEFKVPEKPGTQRYVAEFLKGTPAKKGGTQPTVQFVREYVTAP